jgi:CRP/FNR family cyclic AMP-dependent transcriptional regulator
LSVDPQLLADVPFFELLDAEQRAILAARVETTQEKAGHAMWGYGDPGDSLYIVRSGAVEIYFKNDTGERIVLETARTGDFFGEISLLDGGPRTASALVTEDLDAVVVDRGDLDEFLSICPAAALSLLAASGRRMRETAKLLRHSVSRDINEETEDKRTTVMKVADWISEFSGSLEFLFIHLGLFFIWIILNIGPLAHTRIGNFDPFPFGLLTMVVSLEAIILSVFVLLSQNRQVARDRVRNDIEYQVNLKAELEIGHLHEKLDQLHEEAMRRLSNLEKASGNGAPRGSKPGAA